MNDFKEDKTYRVAVPKDKEILKEHLEYSYPQWKLVDCETIEDASDMVVHGKVDCFIMGTSQALLYDNDKNLKSIPLTKTVEACFAVKEGDATLLSILNKTIKAMPSDMLTSAIAIYDSTVSKMSFYGFLKDNLAVVLSIGLSIIIIILMLLQKAKIAESNAKMASEKKAAIK